MKDILLKNKGIIIGVVISGLLHIGFLYEPTTSDSLNTISSDSEEISTKLSIPFKIVVKPQKRPSKKKSSLTGSQPSKIKSPSKKTNKIVDINERKLIPTTVKSVPVTDPLPNSKLAGTRNVDKSNTPMESSAYLLPDTLILNYTEEAESSALEGDFIVDVYVNRFGKPTKAKLRKKMGHGMDKLTIEAILRSRYHPAINKKGSPTASWTKTRITLILE